jgi:alpha-L-fucosidase
MTVPAPETKLNITSMGTDTHLLNSAIKFVTLLGSSDSLKWEQKADGLEIVCPAQMSAKIAAVFKIELELPEAKVR